jgi:hypothetical protein
MLVLFPKIKSALKGTRFESVDSVKAKATELMNKLSEDDLQHCFQQWKIRREWCRDRGGDTSRVTAFLLCNFFYKKFSNIRPVLLYPHHIDIVKSKAKFLISSTSF